jgi:hypothetical protein
MPVVAVRQNMKLVKEMVVGMGKKEIGHGSYGRSGEGQSHVRTEGRLDLGRYCVL